MSSDLSKPPQRRSSVAGWLMFAIAIVLVVAGMAALGGFLPAGSPDTGALFDTYFTDLDAAQANGQIQAEGITQNLRKKGEDAQAYVSAGERDKALNELNALLNELNAMAGNQVAEPDASTLIADVQAIIDALNQPTATVEAETAAPEEVTQDVTATQEEAITETPTPEISDPGTMGPTPVTLTPMTEPFSVYKVEVGCSQTIVHGYFGPDTPMVRATVNLASNLGVMLAEITTPRDYSGGFSLILTYPQQAEGTRLIVAVGEWDGSQFIHPATLQGFDCTDAPTGGTGTIQPSIAIATGDLATYPFGPTSTRPSGPTPTYIYYPTLMPPVTPTGGGKVEYWTITSQFISTQGCDSSVTPVNAIMPSWLEFNPNNRLTAVTIPDKRWEMFPQSNDPNAYAGSIVSWDVTQKIEFNLTLVFLSPNELYATETVTTTLGNAGVPCRVTYSWMGNR